MRTITLWSEVLNDKQDVGQCVYDVAFKPDGTQILAAAGNKVLVYNATDGKLIAALKGHKDNVYCVTYSKDGKRFASGSSDKSVIVWTDKLKGILKFTHNDALQCMSYNPVTPQLITCAVTDFGLWSPEQKTVNKHKMHHRITCCSWTNDGQYVALGLYSGLVSIRSKMGEEKVRIERPGSNPVWCLQWNLNSKEVDDVLTVGDWGQKVSFYHLNGKQIGKDIKLDYDPLTIQYFDHGKYLLVGGSNNKLCLYSRDGIYLGVVTDCEKGWVWSSAARYDANTVVIGHQNGLISTCAVSFSTVHGLYQDTYAYRDNLTEVVVQKLNSSHYVDVAEEEGSKLLIRCNDLVKKISVFKDKLAVQLSDRIVLYQFVSNDQCGTTYKQINRIIKQFECNLLVVCSQNIILCQENKLTCLSMEGSKEREWTLEANIRYIKVIGGPVGREGLLLGLKNGQVLQIFVDNPFPIELLRIQSPVRCLDLSMSRSKIAIINDNSTCLVYDLHTKELLFEELYATSVAWNTRNEEMLCYSDKGVLHIKAGNFPAHHRKMSGFVVGYCGSRIYCLNVQSMKSVDVPQSAPMYQYLDRGKFKQAYSIACLGVTEEDWDQLAHKALEGLNLEVARKAFTRTRNLRYLELIQNIEEQKKRDEEIDTDLFLADICAYKSQFSQAARLYRKIGMSSRAVDMYTDLRMFQLAKEYVESTNPAEHKQLIAKQASWAKNTNEPREAAKMYLSAGEDLKALEIIGQHGWTDMLMQLARKCDKGEKNILLKCADHLKRLHQFAYCVEVYNKLGDKKAVVMLHVDTQNWDEAFEIVEKNPDFKNDVYVPYAQWLAENDRFEESQKAFHKAGKIREALHVLEQLTDNAVVESRFNDAGYYYWMLSMQCIEIATNDKVLNEAGETEQDMLEKFTKYQRLAEIYYVYHSIHMYAEEPFTSHLPEALFNLSRFLIHATTAWQYDVPPKGVSKVSTLWALAKQARHLGAYKVARYAYEKLQQFKLPTRFQDTVDIGSVSIRSKPFYDAEDLMPLCYRCSTTNPCMSPQGSKCVNCRQPFVYSFSSFEVLPLVEFTLEKGISDEEACRLIESTLGRKSEDNDVHYDVTNEVQSLKIQSGGGDFNKISEDPFDAGLLTFDPEGNFQPVVCNRKVLSQLQSTEVIIRKWNQPLRFQFFRNLLPEVQITMCDSCFQMFHSDDFELVVLQKHACPFCRNKTKLHLSDDHND